MKRLAKAILNAQRIREESFNHKAADIMEDEDSLIKDFRWCYIKSQQDAADEAVEIEGLKREDSLPVYLLNKYCWNDIQVWAEDKLK